MADCSSGVLALQQRADSSCTLSSRRSKNCSLRGRSLDAFGRIGPCNLELFNFIVFAVEFEFHETSHLFARAAARGFTVEQAIGAVKAPLSVMRNPQNKGNHGGLIRLFFRAYGDKVLVVVAEIKRHECWIITG